MSFSRKKFDFEPLHVMSDRENRAKGGGICVANHTSPIDVVILGCDNTYAMVNSSLFLSPETSCSPRSQTNRIFRQSATKSGRVTSASSSLVCKTRGVCITLSRDGDHVIVRLGLYAPSQRILVPVCDENSFKLQLSFLKIWLWCPYGPGHLPQQHSNLPPPRFSICREFNTAGVLVFF